MKMCNKYIIDSGGVPYCCEDRECQKSLIEQGWRAALKWAKSKKYLCKTQDGEEFIFTSHIEKELEDE